jgi:hypothetical protein
MWDILQTCRTITDETLCGVGLTADKCQWLAAAEGGDTECAPTPAFLSLQLSCDCDNIEAAVPDLDYAGVVCDAPSAEFVLLSFDDVAYTNPHALVAPSNFHTCAVNATGVLKCWGKNEYGQLGIGITGGENLTANVVTGIDAGTVKELGAGNFHTVALLDDGTVKCWGYNLNGQCGVDTTSADIVNTPVTVPGLGPLGEVKAIGLGHLSTCAAMRTGGLMCWGMNQYGQLGDGTTTSRSTPAYVEELRLSPTRLRPDAHGHVEVLGVKPIRSARRRHGGNSFDPTRGLYDSRRDQKRERRKFAFVRIARKRKRPVLGSEPQRSARRWNESR